MTLTAVVSTLGVLLALLLISAAWTARKPGWQIVFGPPADSPNRLPVTEFCIQARHQGWDFADDEGLWLDLAIGLREAGLAGAIEMWGQRCPPVGVLRTPGAPLIRIPAAFWKHHDIDGLRLAMGSPGEDAAGTPGPSAMNNALVRTRALPTRDPAAADAAYQDLHLNYLQAADWLQTDAAAYRGISRRGLTREAEGR
ncbi:MAG: hypothetical protein IT486_12960 [Gammaproteobacteria bacterium]|nr:hypothetical protein [Gammaproteobacteria bacterium]